MGLRIGVDIGGTFTDLVALDEATGVVHTSKALSTPRALLEGVSELVTARDGLLSVRLR